MLIDLNTSSPYHLSSVFIGHIPPSCSENDLTQLFPKATRINLVRNIVTDESRGYAFVDGEVDESKEYRFNGHLLLVEEVASKKLFGWKPRQCG